MKKSNSSSEYRIEGLQKDTKYAFIVQPYNEKGLGNMSAEVIGTTLPFGKQNLADPELQILAACLGVKYTTECEVVNALRALNTESLG